jgi:hypothetical protein
MKGKCHLHKISDTLQSEPCHISDVMRGLKSPNQQSTSLTLTNDISSKEKNWEFVPPRKPSAKLFFNSLYNCGFFTPFGFFHGNESARFGVSTYFIGLIALVSHSCSYAKLNCQRRSDTGRVLLSPVKRNIYFKLALNGR